MFLILIVVLSFKGRPELCFMDLELQKMEISKLHAESDNKVLVDVIMGNNKTLATCQSLIKFIHMKMRVFHSNSDTSCVPQIQFCCWPPLTSCRQIYPQCSCPRPSPTWTQLMAATWLCIFHLLLLIFICAHIPPSCTKRKNVLTTQLP